MSILLANEYHEVRINVSKGSGKKLHCGHTSRKIESNAGILADDRLGTEWGQVNDHFERCHIMVLLGLMMFFSAAKFPVC